MKMILKFQCIDNPFSMSPDNLISSQLTLDLIRINAWKTMDINFSEIKIEKEEITADLMDFQES